MSKDILDYDETCISRSQLIEVIEDEWRNATVTETKIDEYTIELITTGSVGGTRLTHIDRWGYTIDDVCHTENGTRLWLTVKKDAREYYTDHSSLRDIKMDNTEYIGWLEDDIDKWERRIDRSDDSAEIARLQAEIDDWKAEIDDLKHDILRNHIR